MSNPVAMSIAKNVNYSTEIPFPTKKPGLFGEMTKSRSMAAKNIQDLEHILSYQLAEVIKNY